MLTLNVPGEEFFNDLTEEFVSTEGFTLELEHSLASLSKWESIYEKPFLGPAEKSEKETLAYIEAMVVSKNPPEDFLKKLSQSNFDEINNYINSTQSATTFRVEARGSGPKEIISSELIYFWMVSYRIPFECETWHLNRLFSLIRICNLKNSKPNTMSRRETAAQNRALNEQRRASPGTPG